MSDSQPPWHDPEPRESVGCGTLLLGLVGLVMLLPGVCVFIDRPTARSGAAWIFLMISAAGVALIVQAVRQAMRR
jgi:hypothetical protein